MTTFASLADVHYELQLATADTTKDAEINDLLAEGDIWINLMMQRYTSLPVNSDISSTLAQLEARWVAYKYKQRRATPQEMAQLEILIKEMDAELQLFLDRNFQTTFAAVSPYSDNTDVAVPPQMYGRYQEGGQWS